MKRFGIGRRVIAGALLLITLLLAVACKGGAAELSYKEGAYRSEDGTKTYRQAPLCYKAVSVLDDEVVAVIKFSKGDDMPLYAIEGMDPSLWLANENYEVYCGEGALLPSLREMKVSYITCSELSSVAIEMGRIEGAAEIADLVDIYEKGTTIPSKKVTATPTARYEILFFSSLYPGLTYSMEYRKYSAEVTFATRLNEDGSLPDTYPGLNATVEELAGEQVAVYHLGDGLLYDRTNDRYYAIGDLLEGYFTAG